jgi:hypothetical protein
MIIKPSFVAAIAGLLSLASGHPGEKHDAIQERRDAAVRHSLADANKRSIDACSGGEHVKARRERAMQRRLETFKRLRHERGLGDRGLPVRFVESGLRLELIDTFYQIRLSTAGATATLPNGLL